MSSSTRWRWLHAALICSVAALGSAIPADAQAATPEFVTRVGSQLMLGGQPFVFTGLNIYNANSDGWCGAQMNSGSRLDDALTSIGAGKEVFRSWFFQPLAIDKATGLRDWSAFDHTLQVAEAHGMKVIATLTDQWGECGSNTPGNGYKTASWYVDGYKQVQPGMLASYRDWVDEVVTRYQDDPRIAFWQLINEAEVNPNFPGGCPSGDLTPFQTLEDWATDVSGLVKGIDQNHLVSLGTIGSGQCGADGPRFQDLHAIPTIDLCEYHDYGSPLVGIPGDPWNGLQLRIDQCSALNKPIFIGESGIVPNDIGGTLQARAAAFQAKINAEFAAGVQGLLAWAWSPASSPVSTLNNYDLGPGDPALGALIGPGEVVPPVPSSRLVGGAGFMCSITSAGGVSCWGNNNTGQLGDGTYTRRTTPTPVLGIGSGVTQIAAGLNHACALKEGGVWCWGSNVWKQLGTTDPSDSSEPIPVPGLGNGTVQRVAAGALQTCALLVIGQVECWGEGSTALTPISNLRSSSVVQLVMGGSHGCALFDDGAMQCWGYNGVGQLGDGTQTSPSDPHAAVDVAEPAHDFVSIGAGYNHTCAITELGRVKCWGENYNGQLGRAAGNFSPTPGFVEGIAAGASGVAGGSDHTCAKVDDGVECWGAPSGRLGDGTLDDPAPSPVIDLSGVAQIGTSLDTSCALTTGGAVSCWGSNFYGQLGDGTTLSRATPAIVVGIDVTVADVASGWNLTCALISGGQDAGTVRCVGENRSGSLGDGTHLQRLTFGDPVSGLTDVQQVVAGISYACALKTDHHVWCWGRGLEGQLGNGQFANSDTPVEVLGLTDAEQISANSEFTCAVRTGGGVVCWGNDQFGRLGDQDGNPNQDEASPQPVALSEPATQVSAGGGHACAVLVSGAAECWGWNGAGQLGNDTTIDSQAPVHVLEPASDFLTISAGRSFTCGLVSTGYAVKCWGDNVSGQLGIGAQGDRHVPTTVDGLGTAQMVSTASDHACAVSTFQETMCWGRNDYGQLGDGTMENRPSPTPVTGLSAVGIIVRAGGSHTCVVTATSHIECWGSNIVGELGDGYAGDRASPRGVIGFEPPNDAASANFGAGGGTTSTNAEPTPWDPVGTSVTTPGDGAVSIAEQAATTTVAGYNILGQEVAISAPPATPDDPLVFTFLLDATLLPAGVSVDDIGMFVNGSPLPRCFGATTVTVGDACVSEQQIVAGGDLRITVLSTHASVWSVGVAVDSDPPVVTCDTPTPSFALMESGAQVTATVTDDDSGPVATTVSAPGDTSSGGSFSVLLTGRDRAGNVTSQPCPYEVRFPNLPPSTPTDLAQTLAGGGPLPIGATSDGTSVTLRASVSDTDEDQVRLEAEVKPVGIAFDGSSTVVGPSSPSGTSGSVTVTGLARASRYHWRVRALDDEGLASGWIPFGGNPESAADFSVEASIVFSSARSGGTDIYAMAPDGSGPTRLTTSTKDDLDPVLSPDGTKIAFVSGRDGNLEIYVMNVNGTGVTRLTTNKAKDLEPAWSPDGTKIVFASDRDKNLEIYMMNADGTQQARLTTATADDREPTWSPSGTTIAFASMRDKNWEIYSVPSTGGPATRIASNPAADTAPAWSPDGSTLAFTSNRGGNTDIYVMNANGSGVVRLTTHAKIDREAAWSRDGTRLVFVSNRDGNAEIYRMSLSGSGQTRLTVSAKDETDPAW